MNALHLRRQTGFTLVELLIVIVVIAILATIAFVAYNGMQDRARDSRTDTGLRQIQRAVELYRVDNGIYPDVCGTDNAGCGVNGLVSALSPEYMPPMPMPPYNLLQYVRGSESEDAYAIYVRHHAKADCKAGKNIKASWFGSSTPIC